MKRVIIISPYFPPSNAADMQRVRMSLPYFKEFGWDATVVTVDARYSEMVKDELLLQSIPADIKLVTVNALSKRITAKFGLGSLALRSLCSYREKVNEILKNEKYDLIYFSTTQFPVCILGAYWKKRFNIPYVIDMQDLWHSDYYKDKPKEQQPKKYWFSYRLHKYLEPIAMSEADGLVSVSADYIKILKTRYPALARVPAATITFGAFEPDVKIAADNAYQFKSLLKKGVINVVYVGRGGADMHKAIAPVFEALRNGLDSEPALFNKLKFYFIGTSYAPAGQANPTILPLADQYGVQDSVTEVPARITYYHTLSTLQEADALFIPGSDDPKYSASKIYPYLLTKKPLLAIFNENSNVINIIEDCAAGATILTFKNTSGPPAGTLYQILSEWAQGISKPVTLLAYFKNYSAAMLTQKQTDLFAKAIKHFETKNTNA